MLNEAKILEMLKEGWCIGVSKDNQTLSLQYRYDFVTPPNNLKVGTPHWRYSEISCVFIDKPDYGFNGFALYEKELPNLKIVLESGADAPKV